MENEKTTEYVKLDDVLTLLLYEIQSNQKARESSTNQAEQVIKNFNVLFWETQHTSWV